MFRPEVAWFLRVNIMKSYEIGLGTGFMNVISKLQAAKAKID